MSGRQIILTKNTGHRQSPNKKAGGYPVFFVLPRGPLRDSIA